MVGVIVYKLLVYRPLAQNPLTASRALQIANISGAVFNLICIMILSRVKYCFDLWFIIQVDIKYSNIFKMFIKLGIIEIFFFFRYTKRLPWRWHIGVSMFDFPYSFISLFIELSWGKNLQIFPLTLTLNNENNFI